MKIKALIAALVITLAASACTQKICPTYTQVDTQPPKQITHKV